MDSLYVRFSCYKPIHLLNNNRSNEIYSKQLNILAQRYSLAMTDILSSPDTFVHESNSIGKNLCVCTSYRNSWKLIRISS
jgi:hypothetical protein